MSFLKLGKTFVCCATSCSSSKDGNPGKGLDEPREELKQALSSHEAKTYEKQEVPKGGEQNALYKIATKHNFACLLTLGGKNAEHFIQNSNTFDT